MFLCRESELLKLNKRYSSGKWECIVIYGRRRVGKTSLIKEFCRGKDTVYFSALNASFSENLAALSAAIYNYKDPDSETFPVFKTFDDAFSEIEKISKRQRIIFVIDEYPYLAKSDPSVSSRIQHIIDHRWKDSNIYMILCGSSMSFMQQQVLGYESPLYGRRTAQFYIKPMTYRETAEFAPNLSYEEKACLYGVTGGIPHYINKLDVSENLDTALLENFFDTSAYLYEEPENLLKQELREPGIYNSIISAIAGGHTRLSEIASCVSIETGQCMKYINVLISLGILIKETPFGDNRSKKSIYLIDDNFFRFWYRFVPRNITPIVSERFSAAYDKTVKSYLHDYMGLVFEKMCREYLTHYAEDLPFTIGEIGQWWGTDKAEKKEVQIDIVASSADKGDEYIIGSCKFRSKPVDTDEAELIRKYAEVFGKGKKYFYYIFSLGGFTDKLKKYAENNDIVLVSVEDMYRSL